MNVRLVVEIGRKRKVVNLRGESAIIGRSHGNAIRIPSAQVSRRHCRLLMDDGLVTIEDMDSVNGTFLNGRRIKESEVVRPGDRIEIGPVTFTVEYELTPAALNRLQGDDDSVEMLEALADGEIMDGDDIPFLEPILDPVDDNEPTDLESVLPVVEDLGPLKADFDFEASPWQLPDGGDLRDLLSEMDEGGQEPPARPQKPKKK
jgi:predicted component of type VI protein secretion system